jgi:dihydrofolate reductase
MSKTFVDVGISLDGYIAGPNGSPRNPMGGAAMRIHEWIFQQASFLEHIGMKGGATGPENDIVKAIFARAGAYVMGRRMFDEGEVAWPENAPFHAPVFVVTHSPREPWVRLGGTTFYFVTDGFESALRQAREASGGKDVRISGGADVIRQAFRAGVVDDVTLHLAPALLGEGVRLFEGLNSSDLKLEQTEVIKSPTVTHLNYLVKR